MKVSVIRRIEAIEQRMKAGAQFPSLILIDFDRKTGKWSIAETYVSNMGGHRKFTRKDLSVDSISDYSFQAKSNAHVILDASASREPNVNAQMVMFDTSDLKKALNHGDTGAVRIRTLREDDGTLTCKLEAYTG